MASNRSRARDRGAALAATAKTSSQALNPPARRAARIQANALPRAAADHVDARVVCASIDD
jgi:hypothetical protein